MDKSYELIPSDSIEGHGIDITAVTKLKHADLWNASKKLGSQAALARHLGISETELSAWINLKSAPPASPTGTRWTEDYICEIESKLIPLTGKSWEDMFPEWLQTEKDFLRSEKTVERTARVEAEAMHSYAIAYQNRTLGAGAVFNGERIEAVNKALSELPEREARIVRSRFGMDGDPKTYEELGEEMGVTKERIRQLEARSIRKLQVPSVSKMLEEYAEPR